MFDWMHTIQRTKDTTKNSTGCLQTRTRTYKNVLCYGVYATNTTSYARVSTFKTAMEDEYLWDAPLCVEAGVENN